MLTDTIKIFVNHNAHTFIGKDMHLLVITYLTIVSHRNVQYSYYGYMLI